MACGASIHRQRQHPAVIRLTHTAPMTAPVVTRFAPSPTGFLHIDRERSTQSAVAAIDKLSWLGLS